MARRNLLAACVGLLSLATLAWACGPYFPQAFLPHREKSLAAPIKGNFAFELGRYSKAMRDGHERRPQPELEKLEREAAGEKLYGMIYRMRMEKSGDIAYELGKGLPEGIRLYTAGAVDFHRDKKLACAGKATQRVAGTESPYNGCDDNDCRGFGCDGYDRRLLAPTPSIRRAIERFEAVLALPDAERQPRATWAAYSLAEIYFKYDLPDRIRKADQLYRDVQRLARNGFPDPLKLASASLGQRAYLKLEQHLPGPAIDLYLRQGSSDSLKFVAEMLLGEPATLKTRIKDANVRKVMLAYAFAYGYPAPYTGKWPDWMDELIRSAAHARHPVEDADRLAVLSYQAGKYDTAKLLAERAETPLAYWVRARLARREGNKALAAEYHAKSLEAPTTTLGAVPRDVQNRLAVEKAASDLDHGRFESAFKVLYQSGPNQWIDTAYVAERILTIPELRSFVDSVPGPAVRRKSGRDASLNLSGQRSTGAPDGTLPLEQNTQIHALLARRLMRAGYFQAAEWHFAASGQAGNLPHARKYALAVQQARTGSNPIRRAEAEFHAGEVSRRHGIDILGYELAPDFHYASGNYGSNYVLDSASVSDPSATAYGKKQMSALEIGRFNRTVPRIDKRFHYRYRAVNHAVSAANLLPRRSQAYRALLCHAAAWAPDGDLKQELYNRYLKHGSYMNFPLSNYFGRRCEEPDFTAAERLAKQLAEAKPVSRNRVGLVK
jgi:hypothetical protein